MRAALANLGVTALLSSCTPSTLAPCLAEVVPAAMADAAASAEAGQPAPIDRLREHFWALVRCAYRRAQEQREAEAAARRPQELPAAVPDEE